MLRRLWVWLLLRLSLSRRLQLELSSAQDYLRTLSSAHSTLQSQNLDLRARLDACHTALLSSETELIQCLKAQADWFAIRTTGMSIYGVLQREPSTTSPDTSNVTHRVQARRIAREETERFLKDLKSAEDRAEGQAEEQEVAIGQ